MLLSPYNASALGQTTKFFLKYVILSCCSSSSTHRIKHSRNYKNWQFQHCCWTNNSDKKLTSVAWSNRSRKLGHPPHLGIIEVNRNSVFSNYHQKSFALASVLVLSMHICKVSSNKYLQLNQFHNSFKVFCEIGGATINHELRHALGC